MHIYHKNCLYIIVFTLSLLACTEGVEEDEAGGLCAGAAAFEADARPEGDLWTCSAWEPIASLNVDRSLHRMSRLAGNGLLVTGGVRSGTLIQEHSEDSAHRYEIHDVERFDPVSARWLRAAPMRDARVWHGQHTLNDGRVLVFGGEQDGRVLASAEVYDPAQDSWKQAASMHLARSSPASVLLPDGRVLVTAGRYADTEELSSAQRQAEIYDPVQDVWTALSPIPLPISRSTVTPLDDERVLVVGHVSSIEDITIYEPRAFLYFMEDDRWEALDVSPWIGSGHLAVRAGDGRVVLFGGLDWDTPASYGAIFDPRTDRFEPDRIEGPLVGGSNLAALPDGQLMMFSHFGGFVFDLTTQRSEMLEPHGYFRQEDRLERLCGGVMIRVGGAENSYTPTEREVRVCRLR